MRAPMARCSWRWTCRVSIGSSFGRGGSRVILGVLRAGDGPALVRETDHLPVKSLVRKYWDWRQGQSCFLRVTPGVGSDPADYSFPVDLPGIFVFAGCETFTEKERLCRIEVYWQRSLLPVP